jgi:hypothetical protein
MPRHALALPLTHRAHKCRYRSRPKIRHYRAVVRHDQPVGTEEPPLTSQGIEVESPSGDEYLIHWVASGNFLRPLHYGGSEVDLVVAPIAGVIQRLRRRNRVGFTVAVVRLGGWLDRVVYRADASDEREAELLARGAVALARGGHFDEPGRP